MTLAIDIIALLIVAVCAIIAYLKGFVKTFFGFISAILALILACFLYKPLAVYIKDTTDIDDWVYESIVSLNKREAVTSGEKNDENKNNHLVEMIDSLPQSINESLDLTEKKEQLIIEIATKVSEIVVNILAWIIIYVIVRVVLLILMLVFDGIMQLPFLKTVNDFAGLFLGFLMGIFRVYLLLTIIYFLSNVANISGFVEAIQNSFIVSHLYNHNILLNILF